MKAITMPDSSISIEEKIKILLHEYQSLRQEIMFRTNHGFQLLVGSGFGFGVIGTIGTIETQGKFNSLSLVAIMLAAIIYFLAIAYTVRDISRAASRIRELEGIINLMAGEELLAWESKIGWDKDGLWKSFNPFKNQASPGD